MRRPRLMLASYTCVNDIEHTCGYAPNRHPQTSRMAFGYLVSLASSCRPSSLQQLRQLLMRSDDTENRDKSSQEEQRTWARLKPSCWHSSGLNSRPNDTWKSCFSWHKNHYYFVNKKVHTFFLPLLPT